MSISGSLETFSLPEIFQIIGLGSKSGRLTFNPSRKENNVQFAASFELWFKRGNFVAIIHSLKYQALMEMIQQNDWIDSRILVKAKYSCPGNIPLGNYLQMESLLDKSQVNSLFIRQINEAKKLFHVKHAWFKFEEIDKTNKIASDNETFPWKEMTGKQKMASELSLEALRNFSDWSRFAEEMPIAEMGLQKATEKCPITLNQIEQELWDMSDGSKSLKKIAIEQNRELETIQHVALSMIFAGLVEEVLVIANKQFLQNFQSNKQLQPPEKNNVAAKAKKRPKVSKSLLNNLVTFLKDNF